MRKEMSKIIDCDASECIYNSNNCCHTIAITVGDNEPMCDTYMSNGKKGGMEDVTGGVGSCKVESCSFNESYECCAEGIHVKNHGAHMDCVTYKQK